MSNVASEPAGAKWEALSEDAKSLPSDGRIFYSFSGRSGFEGYVLKQENENRLSEPDKGDGSMTDAQKAALAGQPNQTGAEELLGQIRLSLNVQQNGEILGRLIALHAQAADGLAYKQKITDEACGAGVRALGEAFNVDSMKAVLSQLPVTEIEKIANSYELQAKSVLGGGGRHTQGDNLDLPNGALSGSTQAIPKQHKTMTKRRSD
ncbi:hypothetical protein [Paenibacillus cellulosilyticus]|uniref:hypothetical protein n=1 Tax=Paenibacillus cellulosilyticus TaxID=375489 RepID=UPI001FEFB69F|nr:hypothetical protein [Paenibacillus cellulosilyticus]